MRKIIWAAALLSACAGAPTNAPSPTPTAAAASQVTDDPYLWLEDVTGGKALDWVRAQNAVSQKQLEAAPDFKPTYDRLLAIYQSKDKIPYASKMGRWFYNFWQDDEHVRGIWRRATLAEYRKKQPKWETVLDLDALGATEKENWVWKGASCLYPKYDRCLLHLSRGGADAIVVREFDTSKKRFVDRDAFVLPEAKSDVTWRNRDALYVATDFGAGSLTSSGYPRQVKEWRRGTPLADAKLVFEAKADDVAASAYVLHQPGFERELVVRNITTWTSESYLRDGDRFVRIDVPLDAQPGLWRDQLVVFLRTDWNTGGKTWPSGALLAIDLARFLGGARDFEMIYAPEARKSLHGLSPALHSVYLNELDNVRGRVHRLTHQHGVWKRETLPVPEFANVTADALDENDSDDYFLTVTDFLTPTSLYLGHARGARRELLKQLPSYFDARGLAISQHEAISKDGTHVPYFQVSRSALTLDGSNPTLLYGYGGFELPVTSFYSGDTGAAWLEKGGVYVVGNIRGGGEFGPNWHLSAIRENRQRAYEDFSAVAEDLVARKVTSPAHLGIEGGSNGGLLMGVMLTQRPDLFGAIVCRQPLLDMRRYHHLLAGASWMGEYGNPDEPADWAFISKYSPYQNTSKNAKYPRILFTSSTRDDRVHPGHARKMVARLEEEGHDVLYYENIEGGHAGAADLKQAAYMSALAYTYLREQLMKP